MCAWVWVWVWVWVWEWAGVAYLRDACMRVKSACLSTMLFNHTSCPCRNLWILDVDPQSKVPPRGIANKPALKGVVVPQPLIPQCRFATASMPETADHGW